mmetsp:Transcript_94053/g.266090  ORF Transcript_94053/g.266090 Transcript_94053/m.266090 type:complete len:497 (-) Transcript_94053:23-1513(-)
MHLMSLLRLLVPSAWLARVCAVSLGQEFESRFHVIAADLPKAIGWVAEEGKRRAIHYLIHAETLYLKALRKKRKSGSLPENHYLWQAAMQQVLGALDLAPDLPDIVMDSGKMVLALAELGMEAGASIGEEDGFHHALALYAAACRLDGGKASQIRRWLGEGDVLLYERVPAPSTAARQAAAAQVAKWALEGVPDLPLKLLHRSGCARCEDGGSNVEPGHPQLDAAGLQGLDAAMASFRERVLFPSHLIHTNLRPSLPDGFLERLADLSVSKFSRFREESLRQHPQLLPQQLNRGFFNRQKKNEQVLRDPAERAWWPEMYEQSPEFPALRELMQQSLLEFVRRRGLVVPGRVGLRNLGADSHHTVLWAAVYPGVSGDEVGTRNGQHVHYSTIASCVFYVQTSGSASGPNIFLDPRGAAPMGDWERDKTEFDVQPNAPFHRNTYFFPEPGDIVCFDPWIGHHVPAQRDNVTRVAWAANLQPVVNWDSWLRGAASETWA